ncbi:hypothetical protein ABIB30_003233 [Pedobacter sp. UYP1]|jgi:hypothetical protein
MKKYKPEVIVYLKNTQTGTSKNYKLKTGYASTAATCTLAFKFLNW